MGSRGRLPPPCARAGRGTRLFRPEHVGRVPNRRKRLAGIDKGASSIADRKRATWRRRRRRRQIVAAAVAQQKRQDRATGAPGAVAAEGGRTTVRVTEVVGAATLLRRWTRGLPDGRQKCPLPGGRTRAIAAPPGAPRPGAIAALDEKVKTLGARAQEVAPRGQTSNAAYVNARAVASPGALIYSGARVVSYAC